jgi:hypothetical protein
LTWEAFWREAAQPVNHGCGLVQFDVDD